MKIVKFLGNPANNKLAFMRAKTSSRTSGVECIDDCLIKYTKTTATVVPVKLPATVYRKFFMFAPYETTSIQPAQLFHVDTPTQTYTWTPMTFPSMSTTSHVSPQVLGGQILVSNFYAYTATYQTEYTSTLTSWDGSTSTTSLTTTGASVGDTGIVFHSDIWPSEAATVMGWSNSANATNLVAIAAYNSFFEGRAEALQAAQAAYWAEYARQMALAQAAANAPYTVVWWLEESFTQNVLWTANGMMQQGVYSPQYYWNNYTLTANGSPVDLNLPDDKVWLYLAGSNTPSAQRDRTDAFLMSKAAEYPAYIAQTWRPEIDIDVEMDTVLPAAAYRTQPFFAAFTDADTVTSIAYDIPNPDPKLEPTKIRASMPVADDYYYDIYTSAAYLAYKKLPCTLTTADFVYPEGTSVDDGWEEFPPNPLFGVKAVSVYIVGPTGRGPNAMWRDSDTSMTMYAKLTYAYNPETTYFDNPVITAENKSATLTAEVKAQLLDEQPNNSAYIPSIGFIEVKGGAWDKATGDGELQTIPLSAFIDTLIHSEPL